jgi:predicted MFS family arabinose efflux permease
MAMAAGIGRKRSAVGVFVSWVILAETLGMAAGSVLAGIAMQFAGITLTFLGGAVVTALAAGVSVWVISRD